MQSGRSRQTHAAGRCWPLTGRSAGRPRVTAAMPDGSARVTDRGSALRAVIAATRRLLDEINPRFAEAAETFLRRCTQRTPGQHS
jgi:hypothetical protein